MQADQMLQRVYDRQEILDLLSRFASLIDRRDKEAWLALFVPDAVFTSQGGTSVVRGHDELALFADRAIAASATVPTTHVTSNVVIDFLEDDASAIVVSTVVSYSTSLGGIITTRGGAYSDLVKRISSQWLIAERTHVKAWEYQTPPTPLTSNEAIPSSDVK